MSWYVTVNVMVDVIVNAMTNVRARYGKSNNSDEFVSVSYGKILKSHCLCFHNMSW